jgi:hypothetical protein
VRAWRGLNASSAATRSIICDPIGSLAAAFAYLEKMTSALQTYLTDPLPDLQQGVFSPRATPHSPTGVDLRTGAGYTEHRLEK